MEDRRQLKLALVITELAAGGAEKNAVALATGLDRDRFDVRVYSLGPCPAPPRDGLVRELERRHIPTQFLDGRGIRHARRTVARLVENLRDHRSDIVQTFLFHANALGALAARRAGVPRISTGVRVADPSRWRCWVERRIFRHADRVVCVSRSIAAYCRQQGLAREEQLVVIPNGLDVGQFDRQAPARSPPWDVPEGCPVVLFVGRLERQKGVDWLVERLPAILAQHPDCHVVLMGDGPLRARLAQRIACPDVTGRAHLVGWQSDIRSALKCATLLLLPSRWEGMPNVVLEAMGSGLPVVCARAEGVEELLGPQAAEQTFTFGDGDGLLHQVRRLLHQPELAARFGALNRARVCAEYSLGAMVAHYTNLYECLAACREGPADDEPAT